MWNLYLRDAPIISHAAVALLSVSASEAAVERTFSAQGQVHSDLRNRQGDATVAAEMFIKFNLRTMTGVDGHQSKRKKAHSAGDEVGYCAEMGEDYEEEEGLPSVVGLFTKPRQRRRRRGSAVEEQKAEVAPPSISHILRPPAKDDVQAFIEHIVTEMTVTPRYRWSELRMLQLWTAGQQWRPIMKDTDVAMRNKIMAYVRAQEMMQDLLSEEL